MKYEKLISQNRRDMKTIGERVRDRRKELGMTQLELASKIGYSHASSVQKIEAGIRNLPTAMLEALAAALFTSTSYLCGDEPVLSFMEEKQAADTHELLSIFRLLDDYEKAIVIDTAKSVYKHSTRRTRDELDGVPEE